MQWFGSDRHRQHDPEIEIWAGLPGPLGRLGYWCWANRNFPLPEGCTDDEYLAVVDSALDLIAAGRPAGLVVSLGSTPTGSTPSATWA
jgi:hypothetical protein